MPTTLAAAGAWWESESEGGECAVANWGWRGDLALGLPEEGVREGEGSGKADSTLSGKLPMRDVGIFGNNEVSVRCFCQEELQVHSALLGPCVLLTLRLTLER